MLFMRARILNGQIFRMRRSLAYRDSISHRLASCQEVGDGLAPDGLRTAEEPKRAQYIYDPKHLHIDDMQR